MNSETLPSTRAEALMRLAAFAPRMGHNYATGRNSDPGPGARADVSLLSPAIRHRLLTEAELVGTALHAHGPARAEKFIQEVFWRSYWKGHLELRPGLWTGYLAELARVQDALRTQGGLRQAVLRAEAGQTGIGCFDAWISELIETGWLHNHVRMWVASIWIFTLRLPWVLGADLFLRHLKDADAAANTLSWRWVGGLQTVGKHYVARAENIARHTGGRFNPVGELDENPQPLPPGPALPARPLPPADALPEGPLALLLHEDDLHPESLLPATTRPVALAGLLTRAGSPAAVAHAQAAVADGLARASARFGLPGSMLDTAGLGPWIAAQRVPVVAPCAPVGWTGSALAPYRLTRLRRAWDSACWPLAGRGFFPFKAEIPGLLRRLDPRPPE